MHFMSRTHKLVGVLFGVVLLFSFFLIPLMNMMPVVYEAPALHLDETHECRMWGMIANTLPHDVVLNNLISAPSSLKVLGGSNRDGWGLVYYAGTAPVVARGPQPANTDPNFDTAANALAGSNAWVGVGHVRARSQGGIPPEGDPHPFMRFKGGKWWAFTHNGNVNKGILRNLIGPAYLAANPPTYGANWDDDANIVDSDLYSLWVLKCIEANNWDVTLGVAQAIEEMTDAGDNGAANFLLTNGETLWGFRRGNTLYYYYQATSPQYSTITSQPPDTSLPGWVQLSDYNFITMTKNSPPSIVTDIRQKYPSPILVDSELSISVDSADLRNNGTGQDWYESRNDLPTLLFFDTNNVGGDTSKKAGFTADSTKNAYLTQEFSTPQTGTFSVQWDIYVDSILDISGTDRAGWMLIGDDFDNPGCPNNPATERFVYLAFYKDGGGTSGTMDLVAKNSTGAFTAHTVIASGLNLKQWYTIRVICNIGAKTYDVYVDGVLKATVGSAFARASVTHISFAQWNDGAGAFHVDNAYAPAKNRYKLTVYTMGKGSVAMSPGEASYLPAARVTLTANPDTGLIFSSWTGDVVDNTNPTTITMDSNKTVTATFTSQGHTLTVSVVGSGSVAKDPDLAYEEGSVVTLTATPALGWSFIGWSGDLSGSINPETITMTSNKTVTATFTESGSHLFEDGFESGSFSAWSGVSGVPVVQSSVKHHGSYAMRAAASGRACYLTVSESAVHMRAYVYVDSAAGSVQLMRFRAGSTALAVVIRLASGVLQLAYRSGSTLAYDTSASVLSLDAWHCVELRTVIGSSGEYMVWVDGVELVDLRHVGVDNDNYDVISRVDVGCVYASSSVDVYVDCAVRSNVYIGLEGAPVVYPLTVLVVGSGVVTKNPDQASYASGTVVTLTASPDVGYAFSGWSGAITGNANPASITMDGDKTVTATFVVNPIDYVLTVNTMGSGSVTKDPNAASYASGTVVTLTAVPGTGYVFAGWSGDLSGTDNPETITMSSDKTVTATFGSLPSEIIVDDVNAVFVGSWPSSSTTSGYYGVGYRYRTAGTGSYTATWSFSIPSSGSWQVFARWTSGTNRATNAPYTINHASGSSVVQVNQQTNGGAWISLGVYSFNVGAGSVMLSNNANGVVIADAIRLVLFSSPTMFDLTVQVSGSGACNPSVGVHAYVSGSSVPVSAIPNTGWVLDHWVLDGADVGTANPYTVTMSAAHTLTAVFAESGSYLFEDGFESGNFNAWTGISGAPVVQSSVKHHGLYAMRAAASGRSCYLGVSESVVHVRAYFYVDSAGGSVQLMRFRAGSTALAVVIRLASGVLQLAYRSGGTLAYDASASLLSLDAWHCVELRTVIGSSGEYMVWVDGVELVDLRHVGVDTDNYGVVSRVDVGCVYSSSSTVDVYVDSAVVSTTYIGPEGVTHTITASAGAGGSITPSGAVSVADGVDQLFTIELDTGYQIVDVLVDGSSVGAVPSYNFPAVSMDHTIAASFELIPVYWTITASAGAGGSISPPGPVIVAGGGSQSFTITVDTGYEIADVVVDGDSKGAVSSWDFTDVQTDHTISASFFLIPSHGSFTIAVLPDTQFYSQSYPLIFDNQTRWIVDNAVNMNMMFVLHEGDVVNSDVVAQWANANSSLSRLDGHIPWAVLPGNHDGTNVGTPSENLSNYNTYFPYSRFSGETWYGDAYSNINTNSYVLFSGGEDEYIVFNFQYHPSDAVLAWANTTIATYPNRRAIVVTHDYLNTDGTRTAEGGHIWNNFVAPHADQIFLVLCGHMHGEARRADTANGHTVYQLLADYQEGYPNGGNGWLRILDFRPTEDKIYVKTYSPYVNQYQIDADSQFTLDYDMTSDSPIKITIQSPEDGTTTMDNMPDFKFIPTHDDSHALNCSLWLQNATSSYIYATINNVNNGSLTTLTTSVPIPNGSWSWWINCTGGADSSISEQRTIMIDTFRGDKTFTSTLDGSAGIYWLDLPDNFDNSTPAPLVVFLHGYGGSRLSYPQKYPTLRQIFQSNTWIVVSVDCRTTSGYQNWYTEPSRRDITDILNTVKKDYNTDSDHIHIMGNSMGGGGALKYAMFNTQVIASLVDINGIANFTQFYNDDTQNQFRASLSAAYGGTPTQAPIVYANESALGNELRFENTPVMMLHGTADPTVSVSHSRNLNQSLNALGYKVNYIEVPGAGHDANSLITGRELLILSWFKDNPLGVHALTPVDSPSGDYRWMDVVNQIYSSGYRSSYTYSQATVHVTYNDLGESLTGKLVAQNLKPNFAYQLKLVGTPDAADNELIGLAGRWWQEEWNGTAWTDGQNLNDKGTGSSPTPNDNTYLARKSITDLSSPTGYHYRYTGYLMFDYFITDSNGDAALYFETGSCYHVLWKTSQRAKTADDGPLKTATFDPVLSVAYDVDYPSSTVNIFGEWERLPMGSVNLATGNYSCQITLTEESFHGTGPGEGNWAAAMSTTISFTIAN